MGIIQESYPHIGMSARALYVDVKLSMNGCHKNMAKQEVERGKEKGREDDFRAQDQAAAVSKHIL